MTNDIAPPLNEYFFSNSSVTVNNLLELPSLTTGGVKLLKVCILHSVAHGYQTPPFLSNGLNFDFMGVYEMKVAVLLYIMNQRQLVLDLQMIKQQGIVIVRVARGGTPEHNKLPDNEYFITRYRKYDHLGPFE